MSSTGTITISILWHDELVAAAEASRAAELLLRDKSAGKSVDGDAITEAVNTALHAGFVALHGIDRNPDRHIVVCSLNRATLEPRITNIIRNPSKTEPSNAQ